MKFVLLQILLMFCSRYFPLLMQIHKRIVTNFFFLWCKISFREYQIEAFVAGFSFSDANLLNICIGIFLGFFQGWMLHDVLCRVTGGAGVTGRPASGGATRQPPCFAWVARPSDEDATSVRLSCDKIYFGDVFLRRPVTPFSSDRRRLSWVSDKGRDSRFGREPPVERWRRGAVWGDFFVYVRMDVWVPPSGSMWTHVVRRRQRIRASDPPGQGTLSAPLCVHIR
jgi:hypothetical protein